jgi:uncharacterized protein YegP (UPF0339 family)
VKARIFQDDKGEWRFTLKADNGEPVAQSEGYANRSDCEHTVTEVIGAEIEDEP